MKFRNIMLSMMTVSVMIAAAACGSDDKEDDAKPAEEQNSSKEAVFQGTYALSVTAMGKTIVSTSDEGVKVSYKDNKVVVTLPELKQDTNVFPSADVELEYTINDDKSITLKETAFETEPNEAGKTCKGTLSGKIENEKLTLTGSESYGAMPFPGTIIFPYTATEQ